MGKNNNTPENIFNNMFEIRYKRILKKGRRCIINNCNNEAIQSHFFSRKKILAPWSSRSQLYTLETNLASFKRETKFKQRGINEYPWMKFYGYCQSCDNRIFSAIEKDNSDIDFFKRENQILLMIRGVLKELRKKENLIESFEHLLNDFNGSSSIQEMLSVFLNSLKLGKEDLNHYHTELFKDLNSVEKVFTYKTFEVEKLPIGFSSILNFETHVTFKTAILDSIIVSFFPYKNNSYLILGFKNENNKIQDFIEKIEQYVNECGIKNFISNLLIKNIEDWIIEPEYFQNRILPNRKTILEQISFYNENPEQTVLENNLGIDNSILNLFEL